MDAEKLGNLLGFWLPQALGESLDAENLDNLWGFGLSPRLLGRAWTTGGTMYKKLAFYAYYALSMHIMHYLYAYVWPSANKHIKMTPFPVMFF